MKVNKIAVIACGVLEWNIRQIIGRYPDIEFITRFQPAQLHNNPQKLRDIVQETIDELNEEPGLDGICLGYGVCGRGTIGLKSRQIPLVIPRTQDCLGIFLGSHRRYIEEFNKKPGTRYLSRGWYDKTVKESGCRSYMSEQDSSLYDPRHEELSNKYGSENADFICSFRESWKRNYQRAAYIRFPQEEVPAEGELVTRGMADELNWEHQTLEGDESLLDAMLRGDWQDPRLLVVPPQSQTVRVPGQNIIGFTTNVDDEIQKLLKRYQGSAVTQNNDKSHIGLGIDTGGTYTDAVIYDFSRAQISASTKVPTTHGRLESGIRGALRELPTEQLKDVKEVGISTTLATNAFIEKKGRAVALFLMSPFDVHTQAMPFRFVHKVSGGINMEGVETSEIDLDEVRRLAKEAVEQGCEAFAISGFGSVINPLHEKQVAEAAYEETGLHAVCGHELTSSLNFIERATTAAMNAKLIPLIEELLTSVRSAVDSFGLEDARIMVLKGDGSQMLDRVAQQFPVETVLSGPAASVVGAGKLFQEPDAVVADMGGTTLDVAVVKDHLPVLAEKGARVGDFQTSVSAMAMRTIGLGGDSEIDLSQWPEVKIGPRRVTPVCRLPDFFEDINSRLRSLFQLSIPRASNVLDFVSLREGVTPDDKVTEHLKNEPSFLIELAAKCDLPNPDYLNWRDHETSGDIQRFGFTMTDVLHVEGEYNAFDKDTAFNFLKHWSILLDVDPEDIIKAVHREFRRMAVDEILAASLPASCPWDDTEAGLREWLTHHFAEYDKNSKVSFNISLADPVIPVGAPTPALFPQLGDVLDTDIMLSSHAGVANALGAVAADVVLRETARVRVTGDGALICSWQDGTANAVDLEMALDICEQNICRRLRDACQANNVKFSEPAFSPQVHEGTSKDGKIFMGLTLTGEIR